VSTFVTVGNALQPFDRLLQAVAQSTRQMPVPIRIQHGHSAPIQCSGCTNSDFLELDRFEAHISEADVIITHAGAGSIINAVRAGKVPVVMPRRPEFGEIIDNHQTELARQFAARGKVVVIQQSSDLPAAIETARARQASLDRDGGESALANAIAGLLRDVETGRVK